MNVHPIGVHTSRRYVFTILTTLTHVGTHTNISDSSTYSGEMEKWYADSGASSHMTCDGEGLYNKEKIKENVKIGNGKALPCKTKGDLVLHAEGKITVHLKGVLLVPGLRNNLISWSKITKSPDTEIRFNREYIMMENKDANPLQLFAREDGEMLYSLECTREKNAETAMYAAEALDANMFHRRLGHPSQK